MENFDFTLPEDVSNYVISARFDAPNSALVSGAKLPPI
jgi:hypothetical protein